MTTLSKILALFITAASFAFLGFVMVSLVAGPNWEGMTHEFDNYTFENSGGENPEWSAKVRDDQQPAGGADKALPPKIVDVLNDIQTRQQQRIALLEQGDQAKSIVGIEGFEFSINDPNEGIKALILQDIRALKQYRQRLEEELANLSAALVQTTQEVSQKARDAELKFASAEERREDIYRLRNYVAESDADRFRSVEHQKKLRDTWERYQGVIARLKERNQQLRGLVSAGSARTMKNPNRSRRRKLEPARKPQRTTVKSPLVRVRIQQRQTLPIFNCLET